MQHFATKVSLWWIIWFKVQLWEYKNVFEPPPTRQQEGQEWKECHHIYTLTLSLIASALLGMKPSIFMALSNGIASRCNGKKITSLHQRKLVFGVKGSIPSTLAPKSSVANKRLGQGSSLPGGDAQHLFSRWFLTTSLRMCPLHEGSSLGLG